MGTIGTGSHQRCTLRDQALPRRGAGRAARRRRARPPGRSSPWSTRRSRSRLCWTSSSVASRKAPKPRASTTICVWFSRPVEVGTALAVEVGDPRGEVAPQPRTPRAASQRARSRPRPPPPPPRPPRPERMSPACRTARPTTLAPRARTAAIRAGSPQGCSPVRSPAQDQGVRGPPDREGECDRDPDSDPRLPPGSARTETRPPPAGDRHRWTRAPVPRRPGCPGAPPSPPGGGRRRGPFPRWRRGRRSTATDSMRRLMKTWTALATPTAEQKRHQGHEAEVEQRQDQALLVVLDVSQVDPLIRSVVGTRPSAPGGPPPPEASGRRRAGAASEGQEPGVLHPPAGDEHAGAQRRGDAHISPGSSPWGAGE